MPLKVICSWNTLFEYANNLGLARMAYARNPSDKNLERLNAAFEKHSHYEKMCLEADEMIHTPQFKHIN